MNFSCMGYSWRSTHRNFKKILWVQKWKKAVKQSYFLLLSCTLFFVSSRAWQYLRLMKCCHFSKISFYTFQVYLLPGVLGVAMGNTKLQLVAILKFNIARTQCSLIELRRTISSLLNVFFWQKNPYCSRIQISQESSLLKPAFL